MTGMQRTRDAGLAILPRGQPLDHPVQDLRRAKRDARAPGWTAARWLTAWRLAVFGPAAATTVGVGYALSRWLSEGGFGVLDGLIIALVCATFFWIAMAVSTATAGVLSLLTSRRGARPDPAERGRPMRVALLFPIYNEDPAAVTGNATAMQETLRQCDTAHTFDAFLLSDTRDPDIAAAEERAVAEVNASGSEATRLFYRRRAVNTDRKVGNLSDWVERFGGGYDAMVVLDADSLMDAETLKSLADALAADPAAGLIQSCPRLIGGRTLFARVQQFSSVVYGGLLAQGLAAWTDRDGNYWGHNAIIRTAAFAACTGLPRMPAIGRQGGLILSHDFVEAGLLRRSGWAVRMMPSLTGSWEECPPSLIDYAIRDRRWCHGNLQHLVLLVTSAFAPMSRFHLFHGGMSYLLSPAWFVLLTLWAVLGNGAESSVIRYFSETNPLVPDWPEMRPVDNLMILLFMYGMLLAPKAMGAVALPLTGLGARDFGGWRRLVTSLSVEIAASIAFAPILMVQQVVAVVRVLIGRPATWAPQQRSSGRHPLSTLLRFHALETVSGLLLAAGMAAGVISVWLLPIAASLLCAVPLSALSAIDLSRWSWTRMLLATPEDLTVPAVVRIARNQQARLRAVLATPSVEHPPIAAE